MTNTFENSTQLTTEPFGTHYGVKHHSQTIIIIKNVISNLRYRSASGCEQFRKQNWVHESDVS